MTKLFKLKVSGMTCISCSKSIESTLEDHYGAKFKQFSVNLTQDDPKDVSIRLDEDQKNEDELAHQLKTHINQLGFVCSEVELNKSLWEKIRDSHWLWGIVGCGFGFVLILLSLFSGGTLPLGVMIGIGLFSSVLTLILGAKSYYHAWVQLRQAKTLSMDSLFAISTLSILSVSAAAFFFPWLPMMYEAGLLIFGFRHLGLALEERIKRKIRYDRFMDKMPLKVKKLQGSDLIEVGIDEVLPNDILQIEPGQIIPLDGECLDEGLLYETVITGSALPRTCNSSEFLLAGIMLAEQSPPIRLQVRRDRQNSYLARLDEGIDKACLDKAPLEVTSAKLLQYFIPGIIGLALLSGFIVGLFFPPATAITCAVSVLVCACPCTLGLIIPLAVRTGVNKAAQHGVQFQTSTHLQTAEQINTVVFDLNGTLTHGKPQVKSFSFLSSSPSDESKSWQVIAQMQEGTSHPIGKAIENYAKDRRGGQAMILENKTVWPTGISAILDGQKYIMGNATCMRAAGIAIMDIQLQAGDTAIYFAKEQELLATLIITDPLRDDARYTVKALQELGMAVHLCTGADEATAQRYAKVLGIQMVQAASVATFRQSGDKVKSDYIRNLQDHGAKVAMIGDGPNDAQALAQSQFGVAIYSPSATATTQAQAGAIITNQRLSTLLNAFTISRQTVNNIRQNLALSLIYNLVAIAATGGLLIAFGMTLNPAIGVALMMLQACVILLNVYRFKKQALPKLTDQTIIAEVDSCSVSRILERMPSKRQALEEGESCCAKDDLPFSFKPSNTSDPVPSSLPLTNSMGSP